MPLIYDPAGQPVEIAPGRGDLRYSSVPVELWRPNVALVGGKTVSYAQLFASQMWVAAAVIRMLWWAVRVPLKVYERTGEDSRRRLRPDEHPLAAAVITPWDHGSQAALVQALLGPLLVHGNGLTELDQGANDTIRFAPADWRGVTAIEPWPGRIAGWDIIDDPRSSDDPRTVSADAAMHLAWWSPLGPLGVSPLQQLGVTLSIEDAAQRYQRALFANGARPPSALKVDPAAMPADPAAWEAALNGVRADLNTLFVGPENQGRPALLPPGVSWDEIGHSAVEAELIDQRRVAREEVAAVYQIPPPMLGILDKATYSNIATQREMAYTDSLGPPLVLIEQTLNAHLVRGLLRETAIFVEFDFAGVLRGDRLKEIQALQAAIGSALMTPNEGRGVLNMPRSEEPAASQLYLPMNNLQALGAVPASDEDPAAGGVGE